MVPISELGPDEDMFQSCVTSIQVSYATVPNVSNLFRDPRSISRVFRSLEKGKDLLSDRKFSKRNFLKGSGPRRAKIQAKFENSYKGVVTRREEVELAIDSDAPCGSRLSSNTRSPAPKTLTRKATLSKPRCVGGVNDDKESKGKSGKQKKA